MPIKIPPEIQNTLKQLSKQEDYPRKLFDFSLMLHQKKKKRLSYILAQQAMDLASHDQSLILEIKTFLVQAVPAWHFQIMNDSHRIRAFEAYLKQVMTPDCLVLDIGTGTGILAMLAAKAGALNVISCETSPLLAQTARDIIAANGLSDKITVLNKSSYDLEVGVDLPRKADILISDFFTSTLLIANGLKIISDSQQRLLKANAKIIPESAAIKYCLIEAPTLEKDIRLGNISGFDFSAFNKFSPAKLSISPKEFREISPKCLSKYEQAFSFDFSNLKMHRRSENVFHDVNIITPGQVSGILHWTQLTIGAGFTLEATPTLDNDINWARYFYGFENPIPVESGSKIRILGQHNFTEASFGLAHPNIEFETETS